MKRADLHGGCASITHAVLRFLHASHGLFLRLLLSRAWPKLLCMVNLRRLATWRSAPPGEPPSAPASSKPTSSCCAGDRSSPTGDSILPAEQSASNPTYARNGVGGGYPDLTAEKISAKRMSGGERKPAPNGARNRGTGRIPEAARENRKKKKGVIRVLEGYGYLRKRRNGADWHSGNNRKRWFGSVAQKSKTSANLQTLLWE